MIERNFFLCCDTVQLGRLVSAQPGRGLLDVNFMWKPRNYNPATSKPLNNWLWSVRGQSSSQYFNSVPDETTSTASTFCLLIPIAYFTSGAISACHPEIKFKANLSATRLGGGISQLSQPSQSQFRRNYLLPKLLFLLDMKARKT